jgi:hypothetical protein
MSNTKPQIDELAPTLLGNRPPLPVLVCRDGKVVGDAVVIVSENDPNWWRGMAVRRNGEI